MQKRVGCYKARSEIRTASIVSDDILTIVTQVHGIKFFNSDTCTTDANLSLEELNYKTTATAFNIEGTLLAIANGTILYIIDIKSKLLIHSIPTYEGSIELLSFVPNSKYLIAGSTHGRVLQYRYDGRLQLSRLCSFGYDAQRKSPPKNNYVSAFAFKDELFACAGYAGEIKVLKINSYGHRETLQTSKAKIIALEFLSRSQILSANVDGLITIYSLQKNRAVQNIATPFTSINAILLMPNSEYILVAGDTKCIAIIDTKTAKVFRPKFLSFTQEISHLLLTKKKELLVILQNREIMKLMLATQEQLKQDILHNNLGNAYKRVQSNPMLEGTREHKRVEVLYDKLYMQAIHELVEHNTKKARQLLKTFEGIAEKKADINAMFTSFEKYPYFVNLYLEKKFSLAYALAEKHPALKHTKQYKKMQERFKEAYTLAQKQILLGREDVAKEVLSPYITIVSKRAMIQLILKNNSDFVSFLQAVNTQNYVLIDRLIEKNEIFAQIPTLLALKESTQTSLKEITLALHKGDHETATEGIKKLMHISELKDDLQELYQCTKRIKSLKKSYEKNDFVRCYEILDLSHNLYQYQLTQLLETHWAKLMQKGEEAALKGDIEGLKKILGPFMEISTRADKIGDLLRLAYSIKIKVHMAKRKERLAEKYIYLYRDLFGEDKELLLSIQSFEKLFQKQMALCEESSKKLPRNHWKKSFSSQPASSQ